MRRILTLFCVILCFGIATSENVLFHNVILSDAVCFFESFSKKNTFLSAESYEPEDVNTSINAEQKIKVKIRELMRKVFHGGTQSVAAQSNNSEVSLSGSIVQLTSGSPIAAGTTGNMTFQVANNSVDGEYIYRVQVTLPAGWTVAHSSRDATDSGGNTVNVTPSVSANTVTYTGESSSFGEIFSGRTWNFVVSVTVPSNAANGLYDFDYVLDGDQFGSNPHTVSATVNNTIEVGCGVPTGTVVPRQATCTNSSANNDAFLELTSNTNGDRINWVQGNGYVVSGGDVSYSNAAVIGALPFTIVNNLSNPTGSQDYTIRIFNGDSNCFTDIVVTLNEQDCLFTCNCTDYLYVNDANFDLTHKFPINSNGSIGAEIGSPWLPTGNIQNPHGVVGDLNGNLYVAQIENNGDGANTQLFKVSCDGTVIDSDYIPNWRRTLNMVTIENTIYSIGRDPNGGPYHVYAHDLCSTNPIDSIQLPDGGTAGWALSLGEDGNLYFTMAFGSFTGYDHKIYRVESDLTSYTQIVSLSNTPGYTTHGVDQDEFGNFYLVTTHNSSRSTTIYKINSSGSVINSISDNSDNQSGFATSWGVVYNQVTGKLFLATLYDDCVAVVDAGGMSGNMSYQSALGVPHVSGQYSKAINIVRECCPVQSTFVIDTTLCSTIVGSEIKLSDFVSCGEGLICEGSWIENPGNTGMNYDNCKQTVTISANNACGSFSLSSDGLNGNLQCGAINIVLNMEFAQITAPVIAGDQTICAGVDPAAFTVTTPATGSGTISYQWQNSTVDCNSGFSNIPGATSSTYDPPASIGQTTYYRVIADVNGGCSSGNCRDTSNCLTITMSPDLSVTVSAQAQCPGNNTTITASVSGGTPAYTYSWSVPSGETNPGNTSSFSAVTDGTYSVTVSDMSACSGNDSETVTDADLSTSGTESYTGCSGDGYSVTVNSVIYNEFNSTGTETLTNAAGCDSVVAINLTFNPIPEISTRDTCVCSGVSLDLSLLVENDNAVSGTVTYHPTLADANTNSNAFASVVSVSDTTMYYVRKTSSATCYETDSISVNLCEFDLALKKVLLTSGTVQPEDTILFEIKVYNQGLCEASQVIIHDYIPIGFTLVDPGWDNSGNVQVAADTVPILAAGDSSTLQISLRVANDANGTYVNNAEIVSAQGGVDADSPLTMFNDGSTNELTTDNDIDDNGVDTPGVADNISEQDDYDPAQVTVVCPDPSCLPVKVEKIND